MEVQGLFALAAAIAVGCGAIAAGIGDGMGAFKRIQYLFKCSCNASSDKRA